MTVENGNSAMDSTPVIIGPDLNESRPALDKKLYRQILLPNGLRAVLVSDTVAMHQAPIGGYYHDDGDDEDDSTDGEAADHNPMEVDDVDAGHAEDEDGDESDFDQGDDDDEGLREAAAAMVVGVGSMYDPPEAEGMCHFLEHMLFMGTRKFPTENAFDSYLSKHGGSDNAYTELEYTVYHFELPQEGLFSALDMFAQFFIHPLLLEDAVDRELNSIESEFQLSKNSDTCRLQQLMCDCTMEHPLNKFSWGNLKSLKEIPEKNGVCIMSLLRQFYDQYYYAQNMRLVVMGAYSLDTLQKHVVKFFSDVPAMPREPSPLKPSWSGTKPWTQAYESKLTQAGLPFLPTTLELIYRVIPVKDNHSLLLTWQLPSQFGNWRTKPCDFIAHLLGHEAQGSLFSLLKSRSWVTGLCAGVGGSGMECASSHALFTLTMTLSKDGVSHWREIVTEACRYIGMLRYYAASPEGLPEWIHEELRSIHELSYRFADEQSSDDFVQELAEALAPHYMMPPERLLDGSELLFDYDAQEIKTLLGDYFQPQNMRVDLMSSTFGRASDYEANETDDDTDVDLTAEMASVQQDDITFDPASAGPPNIAPMFGTRYWCRSIPGFLLNEWTEACQPDLPPAESPLSLPPKNPFVAEKLDLKPLPPDDSHHPLVHSSLKICITVGKKKTWFPSTVTKYNATKNQLLLTYEDEDEKWHVVDQPMSQLTPSNLTPGYEGTLDNRQIKYRVIALAQDGDGAVLKFGDESDHHVEVGSHFPPIPPQLPQSRLPQLISNTQILKFWHLRDRKFKRPIAELRLRIVCAAANKTTFHRACADLFVSMILDAITETTYLADVCDLECSIGCNDVGFTIHVHGFDDKLLDLFTLLLGAILEFRGKTELPPSIKAGRFEACLEVLRRRYGNSGLKASNLSSSVRLLSLQPSMVSSHAKLQSLVNVTEAAFSTAISETLETVAIEALYHGNVDRKDANEAKELILKLVNDSGPAGLAKKKFPKEPVLKIPPTNIEKAGSLIVPSLDPSEPNTAVEVYFQMGKDTMEDRVAIDLLSHMMYEPFYDQIRTKDQFGYVVSCDSRWTSGIMGMHFRVVTSTKTAVETVERIDKFLLEYRQDLRDMKEEEFMENVVGLAKNKLDMYNCLSEETANLWSEIRCGRFDFQVHRNEALCLRSITKERIVEAYDEWLSPISATGGPNERRMLVVQVVGSNDEAGRPAVEESIVRDYIDESVKSYQTSVGNATWGKVTFSNNKS